MIERREYHDGRLVEWFVPGRRSNEPQRFADPAAPYWRPWHLLIRCLRKPGTGDLDGKVSINVGAAGQGDILLQPLQLDRETAIAVAHALLEAAGEAPAT